MDLYFDVMISQPLNGLFFLDSADSSGDNDNSSDMGVNDNVRRRIMSFMDSPPTTTGRNK